jgi:hypothetical protein
MRMAIRDRDRRPAGNSITIGMVFLLSPTDECRHRARFGMARALNLLGPTRGISPAPELRGKTAACLEEWSARWNESSTYAFSAKGSAIRALGRLRTVVRFRETLASPTVRPRLRRPGRRSSPQSNAVTSGLRRSRPERKSGRTGERRGEREDCRRCGCQTQRSGEPGGTTRLPQARRPPQRSAIP